MVAENRIFFVLTGLAMLCAAGTISVWLFSSSRLPLLSSVAELEQLKVAHQQLLVENNELKNQLLAIQSPPYIPPRSLPISLKVTPSPESAASTDSDNQKHTAISVNFVHGVSIISEKIQQNPQIDLTAELANKFVNEKLDVVWASQQENIVRDLFLDNEALANILPDSISCKSLSCRIRIPLVDIEDGNRASVALATAIASTPALSRLGIVSGFDYEHAALEIYLPRSPDINLLQ